MGKSAPSWMLGIYYIDLRGDPFWKKITELLSLLRGAGGSQPLGQITFNAPVILEDFEFVNREIELETLDPEKLRNSYWQCALISAPIGYGKSHLLKRLIKKIQDDPQLSNVGTGVISI